MSDTAHGEETSTTRTRVTILDLHSDARGWVVEPMDQSDLPAQANVHWVATRPGAVRGNHYHERGYEVMAVVGPAQVAWREGDAHTVLRVPEEQVYRFDFPPGVAHAVRHEGESPGMLLAFNTVGHDPDNPDVVREELLPPLPEHSAPNAGSEPGSNPDPDRDLDPEL
jgi:UDP-2-acetamido-2,6-beta-L-arabino-hexul-4-ose reductase